MILGILLACGAAGSACGGPGAVPRVGPSGPPRSPGPVVAVTATAVVRVPVADDATASGLAACPAGAGLLSGGTAVSLAGGEHPPPSLHLTGAYPAGQGWALGAGTGKEPASGGIATAVALCAGSVTVTTVSATRPGPVDAGATAAATAACPAGTLLVGGGARADAPDPAAVPALHLIASFPSIGGGSPVRSGAAQAWTATAQNGGLASAGASTTAYARCAAAGVITATRIVSRSAPGPVPPGGVAASATAACPAGSSLVGGGAFAGFPNGTAPQGVHLIASAPAPGAFGWQASAETGGMAAFGDTTISFAVCAS